MLCKLTAGAIAAIALGSVAQAQIPQITTMAQARFYAAQMATECGSYSPVCTCVGEQALRDAEMGTVGMTWQMVWNNMQANMLSVENKLPQGKRSEADALRVGIGRALLPGAVAEQYQKERTGSHK